MLSTASFEQLTEHAELARSRADWDAVLRAWAAVRDSFPDRAEGYLSGAVALREAGRHGEAEELLLRGMKRFPRHSGLAIHHGWVLAGRGDPDLTALHWDRFRDDFPDLLAGYNEGISTQWQAGLLDEADRIASAAVARFPRSPFVRIQHAWAAMARADFAEASRRWAVMRDNFPNNPIGYRDGAQALWFSGAPEEADAILGAAVAKFPADVEIGRRHAEAAANRSAWAEALRRWRAYQAKFPTDPQGATGVQQAEAQLRHVGSGPDHQVEEQGSAVPAEAGTRAKDVADQADDPAHVLLHFESWGDSCEFGFVQRHFGAEPLSLLRWGYVSLNMLLDGLPSAFEGVGEPRYTELVVNDIGGEILAADTRFFNRMHTHVHHEKVERDTFLLEFCSKLKLLKRKMLEDLASGEKIFVHRRRQRLSDQEIMRLHESLQQYGANKLLCIRDPEPGRPSGTVEAMAEGLLIGYLDLTTRPMSDPIQYDAWLAVCRQALALTR